MNKSSYSTIMLMAYSLFVINWEIGLNPVEAWTPSPDAYNIIKRFEGLRLSAYQDPVGKWTIGYGTTRYPNGRPVQGGQRISEADAARYLQHDVNQFARGVESRIGGGVSLYQNQFDALVSFAYNVGLAAFGRSTLLEKLKRDPDDSSIRYEFGHWKYAGRRILQGLVRRREAEANLYFAHM